MLFFFPLLGGSGYLFVSEGHSSLSAAHIKGMHASESYVTKTLKAHGHDDKRILQKGVRKSNNWNKGNRQDEA